MTLRSFKEVVGFSIGATDGALGKVDDVYFDDERWTVRYLVADVGSWLSGRKVLISPHAVVRIDSNAETIETHLTRSEVDNSPPIETDRPISRRMEDEYNRHYRYPPYWAGNYAAGLWGFGALPLAGLEPVLHAQAEPETARSKSPEEDGAVHLRSGREVTGYGVAATDRAIGHIENFLFDEDSWAIRSLVIDTRDWWPGRHVLVSPEQVERVTWLTRSVHLGISCAEVEQSPEYDPRRPRESSVGFRA
jgi:uncharacterized protein YrrD